MTTQTELTEDIEGEGTLGVHIKVDRTSIPYTIATFDGDERVSEWKAALQKEDEILFARGFLRGKGKDSVLDEEGMRW